MCIFTEQNNLLSFLSRGRYSFIFLKDHLYLTFTVYKAVSKHVS